MFEFEQTDDGYVISGIPEYSDHVSQIFTENENITYILIKDDQDQECTLYAIDEFGILQYNNTGKKIRSLIDPREMEGYKFVLPSEFIDELEANKKNLLDFGFDCQKMYDDLVRSRDSV